jgi:hypothetical protein
MTGEQLQKYLDQLAVRIPLDRYVERRFTAVTESGGVSIDMDVEFRGIFRDREPKLEDIVKHTRVLVLAEPGGGKSVVARSAVYQFIRDKTRVPVFAELKEYSGDLSALISKNTSPEILDLEASVSGTAILRGYVLDGIDEIPRGLLPQLAADLQQLLENEPSASVFLTARQAFYAAHRDALPSVTSLFHILDFSDRDIAEYVAKSNVDTNSFLDTVRAADASEEIRNPFVLSIMVHKYRDEGTLSNRRTENLSYIINRLIQSRPRVNQHQQRRALKMLGIAFETCSRNELTEDEAFRVIKEAMRIPDAEARALLDELYNSILKRTSNGLAFQMRSYGEFLAAEALEDEPVDRVKELAFLDYYTPNESWLNAISYLVELNPRVRTYFVRQHPLWTISASPAVFSEEEKTGIVTSALENCVREKQYVYHHPLINVRRLSRFVTASMERVLIANLGDEDNIVRGNALVTLGLLKHPDALSIALDIVKTKSLGIEIRQCAILALVNVGAPRHVSELLAILEANDPLHMNFLDMVGALIDESQIKTLLPLIFRENAMLSAAYYHFREFKSRDALIQTLQYFVAHANELNVIRAEAYVEPIFEQLPQFFDAEIADLCADLLERFEAEHIYLDRSGVMPKLLNGMHDADRKGQIARIFFERVPAGGQGERHPLYYLDQILVSLMTRETAQWLIGKGATELIKELAPYCQGEIRELFRPHSAGVIDAQDAGAKAYRAEEFSKEESRKRYIKDLQERLVSRISLDDALKDFWELKEDYWPEVSDTYRDWLAAEISKQLGILDLEKNVYWKESTLWEPQILPFFMRLIDRYALRIQPDEPLVFVLTGWDTSVVGNYHKRFGLSDAAKSTLERLLKNPTSPQALEGIVRFIESSETWSQEIETALKDIASDPIDQGYVQVVALRLLVKHNVETAFIVNVLESTGNKDFHNYAFETLIEQGHRPTIERALARLTDQELKAGNVNIPDSSPLSWLVKIRSDFAWDKLASLREKALRLELPMLVGLITGALAKIDRTKTATLIRQQADIAPQSWRAVQVAQAIEQERAANIEAAQRTPFDAVLAKLKGSTSINLLKVLCEGSTDEPVFRSLTEQIGSLSNILFDSVGGWGNLRAKPDPNVWLLGCKEAIMVMDGDEGRHLTKRGKPYTKIAKEERKKLSGLPIDLRILERYGIENYFPQGVFEKVLGIDLSAYFPIPDHASVVDQLSKSRASWKYKFRKFVAKQLGFPKPSPKEPLYSKKRNTDAAAHLNLQDLQGIDLFNIIHDIGETAKRLAEE